MGPPTPLTAAVNHFCEFLVVVTHAILHKHAVYPARMFSLYRKYNLSTPYSKHSTLNEYIVRTISYLRPWLLSAKLQSVSIPIFEVQTGKTVARYVFEVNLPLGHSAAAATEITATDLAALDVQLHAHLARVLAEKCVQSDVELSFDYIVRTTGVSLGREWVSADGRERREIGGAVAVPLKDSDTLSQTLQIASRAEFPADGA